jgi:hypothetical protein
MSSNYNNFSSISNPSFSSGGTLYSDLNSFKIGTGFDTQSSDVVPVFNSPSDLHFQNEELFGTAIPLEYVSTDKSGLERDPINPTMGAYEPIPPQPADLNGDGIINIGDILVLIGNWGCLADDCAGDINGDGITNINDLLMLIGLF